METGIRLVLPRAECAKVIDWPWVEGRGPFGDDGNVLKLDCGDGRTTL